MERGCVNNVCPMKPNHKQIQWADVENHFKEKCATAERLKLIRNIPAAANLDASYIKTTADRLIQDMPALLAAKSSYANVVKGTRPAATAPATAPATTAPATTAPATATATATATTTPPSTMQQRIEKMRKNLQAVSQVLKTMTKKGGATRRRRRRRN
jgi:hypothetical protein